ncbi:hypothetical protein ACIBF1_04605 [Spirillospora sp. NPDC050679]
MNGRELLVRGGGGLCGALLLAASMWLYEAKPDAEAGVLEPIRDSGGIGRVVSTPVFSVRVDRVVAARSLAPALSFGRASAPVRTEGVFLAVRARVRAEREPVKLMSTTLETSGGFSFKEGPRPEAAQVVAPEFQPMLWGTATYLFELPKDRLEGARLVVGTGGLLPQLSAAAEVDLGLDKPRAAELVRTAVERYDPRTDRS